MSLDIIKQNRDSILKAELASLIALWDKIDPNKQNKADISITFSSLNDWENLLKGINITFSGSNNDDHSFNLWENFLKDWRKWRGNNDPKNILQILFGTSESLNSGIDKGSPKEKIKAEKRWIANAFGSFRGYILYTSENRFKTEDLVNNLISEIKTSLLFSLKKSNLDSKNIKNVRSRIYKLFNWLLSDDRFPVNDVALWDQAYVATSMFKASLSGFILKDEDFNKLPKHKQIRWRILGIQYDKMGLAEKGFKLASIRWYRNISREIDDAIKELIEVKYPIGNEIYRDETGIYFIVGEYLGDDSKGNSLVPLKQEFKELEDKILEIFKEKTNDEFYPAIYLTKASRGLMNLTTLLEKANENFLKANWEQKNLELSPHKKDRGKGIGICPVCKTRLIYEKDKEENNKPTICKICNDRINHARISYWINNLNRETIWIDEIKDRNNRIASISLNFKLDNWLNGDLLNSLLGNKHNYLKLLEEVKFSILKEEELVKGLHHLFKSYFQEINTSSISTLGDLDRLKNELQYNLNNKIAKDRGKIISIYRNLTNVALYSDLNNYICKSIDKLEKIKEQNSRNFFGYISELLNLLERDNLIKNLKKILENEKKFGKFEENITFLENYIYISHQINHLISAIKNETNKIFKIKALLQKKDREYPELKKMLINFIPFSISEEIIKYFRQYETLRNFYRELFFSSITGTQWEDLIKQTYLNNKINWENKEIEWDKFNGENDPALDILITLLVQFLLRKNPSPARLRRIWESTQEFFKEVHNNLSNLLEIPEWRKKRLVWKIEKSDKIPINKEEELEGNGLKFWARPDPDKNFIIIYLISSIEDFLRIYGKDKNIKDILNKKDVSPSNIKDYLENFEIRLKDSSGRNKNITLRKESLIEIHNYKPFSLITDISPVNYQVTIPAEYLPKFIDKIIEGYDKNFKYVYGKLPLHVGIITSYYKKPLYVSLKALRKIRRDNINPDKLWQRRNINEFCQLQKKKLKHATTEELMNQTEEYYSLYFDNPDKKDYQFYIKPDKNWKKWISTVSEFPLNSQIEMIPNTIDFEFMDTNTRRNDIFYDEENHYKRALPLKSNRPYELEIYWPKFKEFYEIFKDKNKSAKLHKLIELLYERVQNYNEAFKPLLASAFVNILELRKDNETLERIRKIFDLNTDLDILKKLEEKLTEENLKLFIDMFEFWHTALKEV